MRRHQAMESIACLSLPKLCWRYIHLDISDMTRMEKTMSHDLQFYIDGAWVDPVVPHGLDVIDPSSEEAFAQISLGSKADVDKAVAAAKRAFATYGFTRPAERLALLGRI